MENDSAHMNTHAGLCWLIKIVVAGSASRGSPPSHFVGLAEVARSAWDVAFKRRGTLLIGLNWFDSMSPVQSTSGEIGEQ